MKQLCFSLLLLAQTFSAYGQDRSSARALAIQKLCEGGQAEGAYVSTPNSHWVGRLFFVCLGETSIAASLIVNSGSGATQMTLPYVAFDDNQVTFSSFKLDAEDAGEIPPAAGPSLRLQLNFDDLLLGHAKGRLKTLFSQVPVSLEALRQQTFPVLIPQELKPFSGSGLYHFNHGPLGKAEHGYLDLDVINGLQRLTFSDGNGVSVALFNGLEAKYAGDIFYASTGASEGVSSLVSLIHIRGRITSPTSLEFYYFSTNMGMNGPFQATLEGPDSRLSEKLSHAKTYAPTLVRDQGARKIYARDRARKFQEIEAQTGAL